MRAVAQLARMGGKAGARYAGLTRMRPGGPVWTGTIRVREDLLTWPLFRRNPRRIFVDSMSDLFHENLATATIDVLHAVIAVAHWHRFLVLTKRSERMRAYYSDPETPRRIALEIHRLSSVILPNVGSPPIPGSSSGTGAPGASPSPSRNPAAAGSASTQRRWGAGLSRVKYRAPEPGDTDIRPIGLDPWPLPNLWPGISVEDHDRMGRIRDLLQMPAAMRWVCFEPLLGPVRPEALPVGDGYFDALSGGHYAVDGRGRVVPIAGPAWRPLDWVVAGGEIGAGARPMHPDWVRGLRDLCSTAGVPFFFKQWGEWAPAPDERFGQRMVRLGKHAAGRLLDSRSWNQMPLAMRTA